MLYSEKDIDFSLLSDTLFEELCYDLLTRLGFESLTWRPGPGDKGRDIEGKFRVANSLVEYHIERWFFECKNHSAGVSPNHLQGAITWASAEKPDHLAFLIAPHITNPCRDWLDKQQENVDYKIHCLEEKKLKELILQYDELIERYFLNKFQRIFRNAFINWVAVDIFPDSEQFSIFCREINPELLTQEEMAFILTAQIEGGFKFPPIEARYGEACETFITQIIKRMYSLAQTAESYIWDEHEITPQKPYIKLMDTDVPFQWRRLRTTSLIKLYDKDGVAYQGHYHLIFNDPEPTLEILLGKAKSTDSVEVYIHLVQHGQDTPGIVTKFMEEWKRTGSDSQP